MTRFIIHKFSFYSFIFDIIYDTHSYSYAGRILFSRTRISYLNTVTVKKNEHAIDHNLGKTFPQFHNISHQIKTRKQVNK